MNVKEECRDMNKMKIRNGFVSNSSGTSYSIINKTDEDKSLKDLVEEIGKEALDYWNGAYRWNEKDPKLKFEDMLKEADCYPEITFPPGETLIVFGDNWGDIEGGIIGNVFDYCIREGRDSKSFRVRFDHWER